MIKDNHIAAAGGIRPAVERLRGRIPFLMPIEVETESLEQVQEALGCGVQVIMLDNMPVERMREAVQLIAGRALTEASGNITLDTLAAVAATGVDYISTSATITRAPGSTSASICGARQRIPCRSHELLQPNFR